MKNDMDSKVTSLNLVEFRMEIMILWETSYKDDYKGHVLHCF